VVSKRTAGFACVWYQGRKHESVGWVSADKVAPLPAPPLDPVRDWLGTWSDGAGTIRITPAPGLGRMQIASTLRWDGGTGPNGEPRANFGGMHGLLEVQGAKASAAEGACRVVLTGSDAISWRTMTATAAASTSGTRVSTFVSRNRRYQA